MTTTDKNKYPKISAALAALNLEYDAVFVPLSDSRHKEWKSEKSEHKNPTLNWKIKIGRKSHRQPETVHWAIETDWSAGIAHAPGYSFQFKRDGHKDRYFETVAEKGKYLSVLPKFQDGRTDWYEAAEKLGGGGWTPGKKLDIPKPEFRDVMYSLLMDSDALDYNSYEDWASNFGFDEDSRRGEATYKQCVDLAIKMRNLFGDGEVTKLREIYQDEGF